MVIRHAHNLQRDHPKGSSAYVTSHTVTATLVTMFSTPRSTPHDCARDWQLVLPRPFALLTDLPNSPSIC